VRDFLKINMKRLPLSFLIVAALLPIIKVQTHNRGRGCNRYAEQPRTECNRERQRLQKSILLVGEIFGGPIRQFTQQEANSVKPSYAREQA
jgi:hypothetical protein